MSAKEIGGILQKKFPTINKSTFYRQIISFKNDNIITELQFPNEREKRYELKEIDHHHHLICKGCGKVEEIEMSDIEKILNKKEHLLAQSKKFKSVNHHLEFLGICLQCK